MSQVFEFKLLLLPNLELALFKEDYKRNCRFTSVKKGITSVFLGIHKCNWELFCWENEPGLGVPVAALLLKPELALLLCDSTGELPEPLEVSSPQPGNFELSAMDIALETQKKTKIYISLSTFSNQYESQISQIFFLS